MAGQWEQPGRSWPQRASATDNLMRQIIEDDYKVRAGWRGQPSMPPAPILSPEQLEQERVAKAVALRRKHETNDGKGFFNDSVKLEEWGRTEGGFAADAPYEPEVWAQARRDADEARRMDWARQRARGQW